VNRGRGIRGAKVVLKNKGAREEQMFAALQGMRMTGAMSLSATPMEIASKMRHIQDLGNCTCSWAHSRS